MLTQKEPLSTEECGLLARLLTRMEWPLSLEVFFALMPKINSTPIEFGVFDSKGRVLMTQRKKDDPEFPPGSWHIPGCVVLPDEPVADALQRLIRKEVVGKVGTPISLGWHQTHRKLAPTRPAIALLHAARSVEPYEEPGTFFSPDELPENTLLHHRELIAEILKRLPKDFY